MREVPVEVARKLRMRQAAGWAGVGVSVVGVMVLAGWLFEIEVLKRVMPGMSTMKVNTAGCLLMCGAGLVMRARSEGADAGWGVRVLGVVAAGIAWATIGEHLFGWELGIDAFWKADPASAHPGRMSMATATAIVAVGIGVGFSDKLKEGVYAVVGVSGIISMLGVLGLLYGATAMKSVPLFSTMAVHTAGCLLVLSVGLVLERESREEKPLLASETLGGRLMRRVLPAMVVIPLVVGYIRLKGQEAGLYGTEFGLALFAMSNILCLTGVVWWNARLLDRADGSRRELAEGREMLLASERAARERAERASVAKDELLSVVSHELRTPLTPVMLLVSAFEGRTDAPADLSEELEMMREQIGIEVRLIDDLLDMVSVGSGKLALKRSPLDLGEVVRRVTGQFEGLFRAKGVGFEVECGRDRGGIVRVSGDRNRVQQVIRNLVDNALKFTPTGGEVRVRCHGDEGGRGCVEVWDSGVGIEPAAIEKIFEAFTQGDSSTTRRFGGLGLGLTIAKALVEAHGGVLEVKSEGTDRGTVFTVRLPGVEAEVERKVVEVGGGGSGVVGAVTGLELLVVEDNQQTLEMLGKLLRAMGHRTTLASSAHAAIEAVRGQAFDLLISDIGLPDIDGWEMMRRVREIREVRGIAVSGFVSDADRERSLAVGYVAHLAKPVALNGLMQAIEGASRN